MVFNFLYDLIYRSQFVYNFTLCCATFSRIMGDTCSKLVLTEYHT